MGGRRYDRGKRFGESAGAPRWTAWRSRQLTVPSWLLSLVLHAGLMLAVLLIWRAVPQGAVAEPGREVGIVIAHRDETGDFYEGENDADADQSDAATGGPPDELIDAEPPVDPRDVLPSDAPIIGPGLAEPGRRLTSQGMQRGAGSSSAQSQTGGAAHTKVFNLEGSGFKFVYVFDRSGSMRIHDRAPLRAAKNELLASLDSLDTIHQFQIIFYNEKPTILQLAASPGALVFGNERNKQLARQFIGGIDADGATRHEDALVMALRLRPDVIFFLTDGDDALSRPELSRVRRMNAGRTSINAIEFGRGPSISDDNFIAQLAQQNGGGYAYVDVTKLRP